MLSCQQALAATDRFTPLQIAAGPDGNVYAIVAGNSTTSDQIFVFAPDGSLIKILEKIPDTQAYRIAFDEAGNLYVIDRIYDRSKSARYFNISRLDSNGSETVLWSNANRTDRIVADMTVSPDGVVYFSTQPSSMDNSTWEINAIDASGTLRTVCSKNVTVPSDGFSTLAVDRNGTIYTARASNRITVISPDGTTKTIGKLGSDNGTFISIMDIAVGPDGYLYVAEIGNRRVQKLTTDGTFVAKWEGCGPDPFIDYLNLAVDANGRLYVADERNERIVWLAQDYSFGLDLGQAANMQGRGVTWDNIYAGTNYTTRLLEQQLQELQNQDEAVPTPGFSPVMAMAGFVTAGVALCFLCRGKRR
jgi:hypothetical protein